MGTALAHLLQADSRSMSLTGPARSGVLDQAADHADHSGDHAPGTVQADRLAEVQATAAQLRATGQHVSRRALRTAGLRGSNADLGALARSLSSQPDSATSRTRREVIPAPGPATRPG